MNIKISVIMLTYNRQDMIERAILSVLSQSFKNFEFIIIDNGSNDNSGVIAEKYALLDNRIKVFHIEKKSIGAGRNMGIDIAKGEYVTFIDDDDWMYKNMLEYLINLDKAHTADILLCGSDKCINDNIMRNCSFSEVLVMNNKEAVVELLKREKFNAAYPTKMIKKKLFDKIKFLETGKYDDISVIYKHFGIAGQIVAGGEPQYCFNRHANNNSSFTTNDELLEEGQLREYLEAFKERTNWISTYIPDLKDFAQYSEWSYMISMCNKIISNKLFKCIKIGKEIKAELIKNYNLFYNSVYIQNFEKIWMDKYIAVKGFLDE